MMSTKESGSCQCSTSPPSTSASSTPSTPAAWPRPRTSGPVGAPVGSGRRAPDVHIEPLVTSLQATLRGQGELGSGDPAVDSAIAQLVTLVGPALRQTAFEIAEQAASELRAQLPDRTIDVVLVDGDPTLR